MNLKDFHKFADTDVQKMAIDGCIGLFRTGSKLYGTDTEDSDDDYVGVFIPYDDYILGRKRIESVDFKTNSSSSGKRNSKDDLDCTFYTLDKWISLLEKGSPNQVELLFGVNLIHEPHYINEVMDNKHFFLSKLLLNSFCGFAYSQISKSELKTGNQTGRLDIIEKYGYDTKLYSHAIRLLEECHSILSFGTIRFPLIDNRDILDIKLGRIKKEEVVKKIAAIRGAIDIALVNSKLPEKPNYEAINNLQIHIMRNWARG